MAEPSTNLPAFPPGHNSSPSIFCMPFVRVCLAPSDPSATFYITALNYDDAGEDDLSVIMPDSLLDSRGELVSQREGNRMSSKQASGRAGGQASDINSVSLQGRLRRCGVADTCNISRT